MAFWKKEQTKLAEPLDDGKSISVKLAQPSTFAGAGMATVIEIRQREDGLIFPPNRPNHLFEVVSFDWDGAKFETVVKTETVGTTKTKKKGRGTGALVGTLIAPGVGTAVGALVGTGNKEGKSNVQTIEKSETFEVPTLATMTIRHVESGETAFIQVEGMEDTIKPFKAFAEAVMAMKGAAPQVQAQDPYEEVKKAKELLDMGIITQDEFNQKKKELLGL